MSLSNPLIRDLRVRAVRVPMPDPHQTASGVVSESPLVLIDAVVEGGATGHSIVFTYTATALKPTADLVVNLAPLVIGQPLAPSTIARQLAARFRLLGTQGLLGMALSGVDMALWDAMAHLHGLPLVSLLGGAPVPVRAYGAIGYDGPSRSAQVAEDWAARGVTGVKAKIGYPTVAEDVAVIRAIRDAAGPDMAIMVDYNQSLTPADAVRRIGVLEMDEGLEWVEEPTIAHDFDGHARIAREVRTPIQCGENWWGVRDMEHAIAAASSDYMMPDVMKIGGVTGWMSAAALAEAHAIRISNHLWPEISAHLLSVTPTAHWLEYADWWNPILREPLQLSGGTTRLTGSPGCGIDWNENAVGRFLV